MLISSSWKETADHSEADYEYTGQLSSNYLAGILNVIDVHTLVLNQHLNSLDQTLQE